MATAKTTTKKRSTAKTKSVQMRTLRRSPEQFPFFTYRLTQQSAYWLILCLLILALGIWVITLSVRVQTLYDRVDKSTSEVRSSSEHADY